MDWTVILTRRAEKDLSEIVRYVAADNPSAAEKLARTLLSRIESLGCQPGLGVAVKNWKNIRALLHRKYYIIYLCDETAHRIAILRFWDSARDLGRLRLHEPGESPW